MSRRLTTAQAVISFLKNQFTERDGKEQRLFEGCLGIFGHGNVAGIGQALEQDSGLQYYLFRNEQAMVHTAVAFARASNRLRTLVCTTSIGPGATNMVTGAAVATINRLPVLLLPGTCSRGATWRRCCSNWNPRQARTSRSTIASSRCRATGIASIGRSRF